ncbi:hypothetical protein SUGI_0884450 [Cryptomeria japonica]|uniref:low affinity inorganic phosphate transporter 1-like n=1 Tax=Cryptomeria japonica TaxID=3369 RepID=UPI002414C395|nr:low affinity inorganic phosphate transporter 1-like [Cryptomeria japonica]GLJ42668.1 hypothetical protein SUGI_0884450 [Cryptomeria japonica]
MAKKQLDVLTALDAAKTQWYHFTAIVIAGMGFFTDAYDLFCITTVTKLLGRIYYPHNSPPGLLPRNVLSAVTGVALCGTLAGQLFFGYMGDKLGRKKVYGMTLMLMGVCSIAQGLSFSSNREGVMVTLCFFRFWLGFGIGGDYPLSATIMSEYANKKTRGAFLAAVFAMQGFGILAGGMVALIVSAAFRKYERGLSHTQISHQADYVWRFILMFGALPAALTFYWRMKMPETARYTALVAKNASKAAADMSRVLKVDIEENQGKIQSNEPEFRLLSVQFLRRHGQHLLGTTSTWFLLDIAFYSQNLFQKEMFAAVGWIHKSSTMGAIHEVQMIAWAQVRIAMVSIIPGYWCTVFLIDRIGRFVIQLVGFFFMSFFMFVLTIKFDYFKDNGIGFIVLYAFTFFFANFGPNSTTFIVPAELFPARFRSTCHGISAAMGKLGAIVGAFGAGYLADPKQGHLKTALTILAFTNALGFVFTLLVPETNGRSLEEISGENDDVEDKDRRISHTEVL